MKIILVEEAAWEMLIGSFVDLAASVERLVGEEPIHEDWLDNGDVCQILNVSKRTLQSYRDQGLIPYSMLAHKVYYRKQDVEVFLSKYRVEQEYEQ